MAVLGEDIYEYHFASLFRRVKNIIGGNTIRVYDSEEEEQNEMEVEKWIGESNLLFDISGGNFRKFKYSDLEYRYWVEVYIVKMIENLLTRAEIRFEEKYHSGCNEQHSIIYELNGKRVETYFLFDIYDEEPDRTNYYEIADKLKTNSDNADKIEIFIFRDQINKEIPAWLINGSKENSANGLVEVFPLHCFFETHFSAEEYETFNKYAADFLEKCNSIISYRTVITPTERTLAAFKQKKCQMLKGIDYLEIANKGKSGNLPDGEFKKVKSNYLRKKMFTAMVSSNDFADSFISAEWLYDVYRNSMGELELTGIIAGYLKSVEQLMYKVVRFHRDQGLRINTKDDGLQPYTKNNENDIDSTLWSLNEFLASPEGKLALSYQIRMCLKKAVNRWRKYERNGYFHKDNLYKKTIKLRKCEKQLCICTS